MKTTLVVIESEADLKAAHALLDALLAKPEPSRADLARMQAQARLIEAHEMKKAPPRPAKPAEILRYLMEQHDMSRADLAPLLGTVSRVSEVLNGKKPLSMAMVQRLRARFGISADLLLPPIEKARAA